MGGREVARKRRRMRSAAPPHPYPPHEGEGKNKRYYVSAKAPRVSVVTATRGFAGSFGGPTRRRDSAATNSAFGIGLANR